MGRNILSCVKMMVSSKGLLNTFAPIVPLPEISPSSQVAAGVVLTKPRFGGEFVQEGRKGKRQIVKSIVRDTFLMISGFGE